MILKCNEECLEAREWGPSAFLAGKSITDSRGTEDYASVSGHLVRRRQARQADNLRHADAGIGVAYAAD